MRVRQRKRRGAGQGRKDGTHYVVSDRSGFVYRNTDVVRQWDGLLVSKDEEEPRHPQEFVTGVVDDYAVRDARPRNPYESLIFRLGIFDRFSNVICNRSNQPILERQLISRVTLPANLKTRLSQDICTRAEQLIFNRTAVEVTAFQEIYNVDLGQVYCVSRIEFILSSLSGFKDTLNIWTSEDGITYEPLATPFRDIIRQSQFGTNTAIAIGRDARYISLRIQPGASAPLAEASLTKFEVYGSL